MCDVHFNVVPLNGKKDNQWGNTMTGIDFLIKKQLGISTKILKYSFKIKLCV